jgi:hypothetical protein
LKVDQINYIVIENVNQMKGWMNCENYGMYNGDLFFGWDIDHIIPVSSAKPKRKF